MAFYSVSSSPASLSLYEVWPPWSKRSNAQCARTRAPWAATCMTGRKRAVGGASFRHRAAPTHGERYLPPTLCPPPFVRRRNNRARTGPWRLEPATDRLARPPSVPWPRRRAAGRSSPTPGAAPPPRTSVTGPYDDALRQVGHTTATQQRLLISLTGGSYFCGLPSSSLTLSTKGYSPFAIKM